MNIPEEIKNIGQILTQNNFEAFLVGGCVRDILINKTPKDWDIATSAHPEDIQKLFPDSIYENSFGTVAVKTTSSDPNLKIVEITTFRHDGKYEDFRHPTEVSFADDIETDLSRRDFTINAMAISLSNDNHAIIDPFNGEADLKNKIIKTVGDPDERFNEDALRLLRAIRLVTELGFAIDSDTFASIIGHSHLLGKIAAARRRDEFIKIIESPRADEGIRLLTQTNLIDHLVPELRPAVGCSQNKHHIYDVFEHSVRALEYAVKNNYSLTVRLASLFHDIGKPRTKRGKGEEATFYAHEIVGAKMVKKILERLHFSNEIIKDVTHLVRYHMFHYNVGEVSPSGVRRFLVRIGPEYLDDLLKVRKADRIGSNVPKAFPYKLRHLLFMIDKVRRDPISPKSLKINGTELMELLNLKPGPKIGMILNSLLEEVIDDPSKNTAEYLSSKAKELNNLDNEELKNLTIQSKAKQAAFEESAEAEMKDRFHIKE